MIKSSHVLEFFGGRGEARSGLERAQKGHAKEMEARADRHHDAGVPKCNVPSEDVAADLGIRGMARETDQQLRLALPTAMLALSDFAVTLVSIAFVGRRFGALHLAGAAMATSYANVFGHSTLEGLSGALETLAGQAQGAGNHQLTGILTQRGILVLSIFCIPICIVWMYLPEVLLFLCQPPQIVELARQYVRYLLPGLFSTAVFLPLVKYLQVQGAASPLFWISCAVLCLHVPLCWIFIYGLDLGFVGAALSQSASNALMLVLLVSYLNFERSGILARTWPGWSRAAAHNVSTFLAVALPSCAMVSVEWWMYEIILNMAGWLPQPHITMAAMSISCQTVGLCFMLQLGLSTAIGVRVANELGAQRPERGRWAAIVGMGLATLLGMAEAFILLLSRNDWALLFTNSRNTEVIHLVSSLMPVLVIITAISSWSAVLAGVLRGSGQQLAGLVVNGLSLYGIAIPLAYYLGIRRQLGLQGLWLGMMVGLCIQVVSQALYTRTINWNHQAVRALAQMDKNVAEVLVNHAKSSKPVSCVSFLRAG